MKFLRTLLATIVGLFVFTFLMFFLLAMIASSGTDEKIANIKDNAVIHLKLNKQILEREVVNPFEGIPMFSDFKDGGIGLMELKQAIDHASEDDKVKGILLETPYVMAGLSTIGEIRDALEGFKASGKFIYSYSEMYTEGAFFLSSVADEVFMNPDFSMLEFNGLNIESMYFKGMFEKLDIEPITFKVGDYKSISEPFDRTNMSVGVKKRYTEMLANLHNNLLSKIGNSRDMTIQELKHISDSALVNLETDAVTYGLVDELAYRDEVIELIREKVEVEKVKDINFVSYKKYKNSFEKSKSSKNRIAVIMASGNIVNGKGENNNIGSAKYAKDINKAANDKKVKAIVIRINSGGGSALASDVMWREIKLASEKKPVIASMSDYAASGGYYMAMACDTILAQPNTITGSIGVFSLIFNIKDFLGNKLGITTDKVKTGHFSDIYTMTGPLSDFEKSYIQKGTDNAYKSFTSKAAEGRSMSTGELEPLASGRVWTGDEALANGLVDMLGDLDDAISIASAKAGIGEDYRLRIYPIQKDPFEEFIESLSGEYESKILSNKLNTFSPYFDIFKNIQELKGIQARSLVKVEF